MKKLITDDLPKTKSGKIKWKDIKGYTISFIYEDIIGEIYIKDVRSGGKIIIGYKDREMEISYAHLRECKIGKILNVKNGEFKIEIGQVFKDNKIDLVIIDREYRIGEDGIKRKFYNCCCNKCKESDWKEESSLLLGRGCPYCCYPPQKIKKGLNDISTKAPWMMEYITNKEECYKIAPCSNKKISMTCPHCRKEKHMAPGTLYRLGYLPCNCSDKIPYSEKFIYNIFQQLNIPYIWQLTRSHKQWCNAYQYDFYFKLNNEEYIIEAHGIQHYCDDKRFTRKTLREEQENDQCKYNLAIQNGIKTENYIVLDCRKSELEWIKNSIFNSKLNGLFDLSNIDWLQCEEYALKNIIKEVREYWHKHKEVNKENIKIVDMMKIFQLSDTTIRKYLKKGNILGWCNYNSKEELRNKNIDK